MSLATIERARSSVEGLDFLWLEITGKCNLSCGHCYADSGPLNDLYGSMAINDWFRVLDEAKNVGCRRVQFIGGEPTIHPRLPDLIGRASNLGFEFIEVFTNATRLNSGLVTCFKEMGVNVATSFYTDDPQDHEKITRGAGSWHETVDGIKMLTNAGVNVRVGIIKIDQSDACLHGVYSLLQSLGVKNIKTDHVRGVGRGSPSIKSNASDVFGELCGQCWKGRLCITNTGDAYPCVFSRNFQVGNVLESGLTSVLHSSCLHDFRVGLRNSRLRNAAPCTPDCTPNEDCGPKWCRPDDGSCSPNDPDPDCGPYDA